MAGSSTAFRPAGDGKARHVIRSTSQKNPILSGGKEVVQMQNAKLHITVSADDITDVRVFLVNAKTGKQQELQPGVNYSVEFVQKRTQRCQVCDRTFPASEIITHNGERLCVLCDRDKYPLTWDDIPF